MDKRFGYIGGFNGKQVEVWAGSLVDAKRQVVEHFKPRKKDLGLVWVALAEKDGQPVVQVAVN